MLLQRSVRTADIVRRWGLVFVVPLGVTAWIGYRAAHPQHEHAAMQTASDNATDAPASRTTQTPISCEKLPNVPGKSITTMLVDFPPGVGVPSHRHAGSVTAYVLKGVLRSQLNAEPVGTFSVGGTWFEPPGTLHTMVENASSTEPAQIMAIFVADNDCGALTIFED